MAERSSAIFWVLCPKQSLHCYMPEKLIHLKALFPDIFAEDKIDLQRLKEILGEEVFVQNEH
ncbi:MAG: hypothetical protein IM585_19375 [Pseudanabaena sp. M135S2SP2A07QC]|jgi:hypothetical protein|nr:hypothetical protein [Pseudanabaena sp. M090S1SP2A07QC]MCA6508384.1 hypothetical protein [Pseudanabaena sp. M172S2SP2A07QC]MCA6522386.1 hypothetical protein [Pseudanabaena sp. M051S1SP2A07QC]MCA6526796.1 hypothetical protein [Pseudanabaena sp. M179S2SP2A07QC]MCA6532588.1 hypothetical protein [Pseudanabaena sp. M125S2SP2A07QC]MCA6536702.1 hypothetical protein [Pseudanabaena sp. M176S2SP2A07QC]MCA6540141.1 hypothetical protein [Pseudanabaena sp. M037S2SP2A07QC]MCA6548686.1 hypothetical prot